MANQHFPVVELNHSELLLPPHKRIPVSFTIKWNNYLHRDIPTHRSQTNYPINNIYKKLIKSLKILKQIFNNLKITNKRRTRVIILLPKKTSQIQVETNTIMIKPIYKTNKQKYITEDIPSNK